MTKRYRLVKELPTFKVGDTFYIDPEDGSLYLDNGCDRTSDCWTPRVRAYHKSMLAHFPNILEEWFEEIGEAEEYYYISSNSDIKYRGFGLRGWNKNRGFDEERMRIGNHFGTEEEAEKAVEKLKAWKRLRDKGFFFLGYKLLPDEQSVQYAFSTSAYPYSEETVEDIKLLFGGEDE